MNRLTHFFETIKARMPQVMKASGQMLRSAKRNHLALWLAAIVAAVAWWRGRDEGR